MNLPDTVSILPEMVPDEGSCCAAIVTTSDSLFLILPASGNRLEFIDSIDLTDDPGRSTASANLLTTVFTVSVSRPPQLRTLQRFSRIGLNDSENQDPVMTRTDRSCERKL